MAQAGEGPVSDYQIERCRLIVESGTHAPKPINGAVVDDDKEPLPSEPLDGDGHHVGEWTPPADGPVDDRPPPLADLVLSRAALRELPDPRAHMRVR